MDGGCDEGRKNIQSQIAIFTFVMKLVTHKCMNDVKLCCLYLANSARMYYTLKYLVLHRALTPSIKPSLRGGEPTLDDFRGKSVRPTGSQNLCNQGPCEILYGKSVVLKKRWPE
jgi:hypothetical protein